MRCKNIPCLFFCCFVAALGVQAQGLEEKPLFSFGVISDVQYADADQSGKRDYRGSPKRLEKCVGIFNSRQLEFVVHAGDLIDRDYRSFEVPLKIFGKSKAPVHYVVGNHEFSVMDSLKKHVRSLLRNDRGYYGYVVGDLQFLLLDALDISPHSSIEGSRAHKKASRLLADLRKVNANNAFEWNGAVGKKQMQWLRRRLREGERRGMNSVIFSHLPLLPENGLQLWNNKEVLGLLHSFPSVIAFISGHHHEGGYVKENRIHHLTLKGLVEATSDCACGIVGVYNDKLVVDGFGDQKDYILEF